jgi:dihydrofolate reductase
MRKLDVYRLLVYPSVLGSGKPLFIGASKKLLRLATSQAFPTGVVLLTYEPERAGS